MILVYPRKHSFCGGTKILDLTEMKEFADYTIILAQMALVTFFQKVFYLFSITMFAVSAISMSTISSAFEG